MSITDWSKFIEAKPEILVGKPIIKGTRLSVDFVLGLFSQGWSTELVIENYPTLNKESILAVFSYASDALKKEIFFFFKTGSDK